MSSIVLPPRQFALQQVHMDSRHRLGNVIVSAVKTAGAKQSENRLRRDRRHEAALVIQPIRIASLGNAVADKGPIDGFAALSEAAPPRPLGLRLINAPRSVRVAYELT